MEGEDDRPADVVELLEAVRARPPRRRVQALAAAEKIDPKHEQVQHAIKMARMMAAKAG